jgi:hypothetical protein
MMLYLKDCLQISVIIKLYLINLTENLNKFNLNSFIEENMVWIPEENKI